MTQTHGRHTSPAGEDGGQESAIDRILGRAAALDSAHTAADEADQLDLLERSALRRVGGLSTELEDITEVEYRRVRLERVVLAGIHAPGRAADGENSLRELAALAETAGSQVLDGLLQKRVHPDPSTYLGSGKAVELREIVEAVGADTVVVDAELPPSQRRALEDVIKVKVIDRVALILDIFAQHAKSREGKAQVELAQLEYLLPRLRGWGESMSRQAGGRVAGGEGIGSRGPGETKIELDRRRIRTRMAKLRRQIRAMAPARETMRADRRRNAVPSAAIVGYTNAGKSSLLNCLTDAGVMVQNALFATLDPTVRRAQAPDGRDYTLTDTVGFVRNLPHQLVEAFRSTLEEAADADLLVHVVDASHPDPTGQISAVREVLAEGSASELPELVVFNKADAVEPDVLAGLLLEVPGSLAVSARTGEGVGALRARIGELLPVLARELTVVLPYDRGELVSRVHEHGTVLDERFLAEGTVLQARVDDALAAELAPFVRPDMFAGDVASADDDADA
ncbi:MULTISPECIES: GTPase HflX [Brevibacterium]|jgi:GTP-binding protein HflX|uniref:GTPase HflX n=1 Tax=Brevibacterium salitolerans TaxID=1403566 RepID=A0ABP5IN19_9MICO|nr:GTPase HflX [Brevibacterium sp.]